MIICKIKLKKIKKRDKKIQNTEIQKMLLDSRFQIYKALSTRKYKIRRQIVLENCHERNLVRDKIFDILKRRDVHFKIIYSLILSLNKILFIQV